jgi:hypothetical protein
MLGSRRRQHARGRADEELILQHPTQPVQRVAHGRLAQAQLLAGLADTALAENGLEYDEEIEIEGAQLHGAALSRAGRLYSYHEF